MNNLKNKRLTKLLLVFWGIFSLFFCVASSAAPANNPCAKYQDPQMQAKCVGFLNAAAGSSQSMVDRYKLTPPPARSAAANASSQNQSASNVEQQAQVVQSTSAAQPMQVTIPVQQPLTQQDTSTMTPWQILSKGHGKAVVQSPTAPVEAPVAAESSSAAPDHLNIYK